MADARLRELERRWRASGSPDDETAWLRGCLHARTLPRERLALAAAWGHGPAADALDEPPPWPERLVDLVERTVKADRAASAPCARGLFAATLERPGQRLEAHRRAALERIVGSRERLSWDDVQALEGRSSTDACVTAAFAAELVAEPEDPEPSSELTPAQRATSLVDAFRRAIRVMRGEEHLRERVAAQVVPWLLGRGAAEPPPAQEREARGGRSS